MKRMLAAVLILVLLLSGCNYNTVPGDGTQPSDILSSQPTDPTTQPTQPTDPTTQPTEPTNPSRPLIDGFGFHIPDPDMPEEEFREQYTVLEAVQYNTIIEVIITGKEGVDSILQGTELSADGYGGRSIVRHKDKLYILLKDFTLEEVGYCVVLDENTVGYYTYDIAMDLTINSKLANIQVYYTRTEDDVHVFGKQYDLKGANHVLLKVTSSWGRGVYCYHTTYGYKFKVDGTELPLNMPKDHNGFEIPDAHMPMAQFKERYTFLETPNPETSVSISIRSDESMRDAFSGITIRTIDGKTVYYHMGDLYILEGDRILRRIGQVTILRDHSFSYSLFDGDYVFIADINLLKVQVSYWYRIDGRKVFYKIYDLEGSTSVRVEVFNFAERQVKCVCINEDGEEEVMGTDIPLD